jgi:hypothetical protein
MFDVKMEVCATLVTPTQAPECIQQIRAKKECREGTEVTISMYSIGN